MEKFQKFLVQNKKVLRIFILVLLALIVALLALNANTNLMPFIYMIF